MRIIIFILYLTALVFPTASQAQVPARRNLMKGEIISLSDLVYDENAHGNEIALSAVLGKEVRHMVYKGKLVTPANVGPVTLIRRNELVAVKLSHGMLEITMQGRALDAGGKGETIRVMNLDTRRTISAYILNADHLEVIQ